MKTNRGRSGSQSGNRCGPFLFRVREGYFAEKPFQEEREEIRDIETVLFQMRRSRHVGERCFFVGDRARFPEILIFVAPKTTLVPGLLILIFRYAIVGDVKGSYRETRKEMPQKEFVNGCGPKGIGRKDRSIVVYDHVVAIFIKKQKEGIFYV